MNSDIDAIKMGMGPTAILLHAQERIRVITGRYITANRAPDPDQSRFMVPPPTAEQLIQFCDPWQPRKGELAMTEDTLLEFLAPYFCFVKRFDVFGRNRETQSRQFIGIKAEQKFTDYEVRGDDYRMSYQKNLLSITLNQASGSSVCLEVNPTQLTASRDWWTVSVYNALEDAAYPGVLANVPTVPFKHYLDKLMVLAGFPEDLLAKNPWAAAAVENKMYDRFAERHLDLTKHGCPFRMPKSGYAFEYLMEQYDREGCAYAEYAENGGVQWIFLSRLYASRFEGCKFFHGKLGDSKIEVLQLSEDTFKVDPSKRFNLSQNSNNYLAEFDPLAFEQFFKLLSLGRQIFVGHQSDD